MAIDPLKYEPLREAHRLAADQEQARRDKAEQSREAPQSEKTGPEAEREKIQTQARNEVELEKAKRYEWQKTAYEQRQRDDDAKQERSANSLEYMRANDPKEYARQVRDDRVQAERDEREKLVKEQWAERTEGSKQGRDENSGREQPDQTREKGEVARQKDTNKWRGEMSDNARAEADQSKSRDGQERERQRSGH